MNGKLRLNKVIIQYMPRLGLNLGWMAVLILVNAVDAEDVFCGRAEAADI